MTYLIVAEKWQISQRRIEICCKEGKLEEAMMKSKT